MSLHDLPDKPSPAQLREIMKMVRVLGTAEIQFVGSLTAPLFWVINNPKQGEEIHGGSLFFLDTGACIFGVTAAHVISSCLQDAAGVEFRGCFIARHEETPYPISLKERIIDINNEIDIATLRFSYTEVSTIGRTLLTGYQRSWPPPSVTSENLVTYAGWPKVGREWLGPNDFKFGLVAMAGIVTSAHERSISIQIERSELQRVVGEKDMPKDFDFGGMSGGPVLQIVERVGLRGWILAGVIFQGPNPSGDPEQSIEGLEIIGIRPAHFINADGTLDVDRWENGKPFGVSY